MEDRTLRRMTRWLATTAMLTAAALGGCLAPEAPEDTCVEIVGEDSSALSNDYGRDARVYDAKPNIGGPQPEPYLPQLPGYKWVHSRGQRTACLVANATGERAGDLRSDALPGLLPGEGALDGEEPDDGIGEPLDDAAPDAASEMEAP